MESLFKLFIFTVFTVLAVSISSCFSATVAVSASKTNSSITIGTKKNVNIKYDSGIHQTCTIHSDCESLGREYFCYEGFCAFCSLYSHWNGEECVLCALDEDWDSEDKECVGDDDTKVAVGLIVGLAVGIPILIIISICLCCCCCAGCAGHAYRQRRNNKQPSTQFIITGNQGQHIVAGQNPNQNRY